MNSKYLVFCICFLIGLNCSAQLITVKNNDKHIRYMGRIAQTDTVSELSWSGSSIKINFTGSGISAVLKDERGDNTYNVIVDNKVISVLRPDPIKKEYKLASNLLGGKHTLELFKRSEWAMGKTRFYSFELNKGGRFLPADPARKRKIEFFGDSITCGYADEDSTGQDRGTSPYENGYLSYATLTAKHFDAEFNNTSKSGIGIMVSWFPFTMPDMYDRLDANDPNSKWDFTKYTPDLVVINLFQNDSWLVNLPNNDQFKAKFGTTAPTPQFIVNAYSNFIKTIRGKYPKAQIICILGSMDATKQGSPWPGYIEKAVASLNDKNIYTHFIPYKNTNGHPSVKEQQAMADDLIAFMNKTITW
ncbi:lysophospholipase L1-like esterase [Mucilaginibacter frigoritolerans]|uniref:Lysophospholipase L1-like esterase n=2 Tax=Mucilaginibacter frigoritolerans TaxID=652788 RepID=A0A562TWT0_9SPHI|nr:lysophospholipase L1-like esterase [Mucilaginibacter frigoritolerans]